MNSQAKYREIAKNHTDTNELSGRGSNRNLTRMRNLAIQSRLRRLAGDKYDCLVDVGCGDGSLLSIMSQESVCLLGVLPSEEEKAVVDQLVGELPNVKIVLGCSWQLPMDDQTVDVLVCNSVLHGSGFDTALVTESLVAFSRVLRHGSGFLYIGEMPSRMEGSPLEYGTSLLGKFVHLAKYVSVIAALLELWKIGKAVLQEKTYIMQPPAQVWWSPNAFVELVSQIGFDLVALMPSDDGFPDAMRDSIHENRMDYLLIRRAQLA